MIDNIKISLYAISKALKIIAELIGYWFLFVFAYFLLYDKIPAAVSVWAIVGSVAAAVFIRLVIYWTE